MSEKAVIEPLGFYVLIEVEEVSDKSKGGIYVGDVKREQSACEMGFVRAIGNTAFRGFAGCNPSDYAPGHVFSTLEPHQIWGIDLGDKVEFRKHEGKDSSAKGVTNMRYIPDTQILGKVN